VGSLNNLEDNLSRSYRTKLKIAHAMNHLAEDTPFSKIHIAEIIEEAGISRSNFYHHFEDRNAVVNWLATVFYSSGLDQIGRSLTWFEGHLGTTRGFMQFKSLFTRAAENKEYGASQPSYVRHRQQNLIETITEYKHLSITPKLAFQIEALPYSEVIMSNN
jgi:AcrR family transcriptional regulator